MNPDDAFTPSTSPRGRSEWIVEARRRNKLEKKDKSMLGGEANRPSNPCTRHTHTHTHTWTSAWLFFLGLNWIGMQSWGERCSEKDLAYKWCPLFDPSGWGGGVRGGVAGTRGGGSSQTSLSASLFLPNSSLSEGGESDRLPEIFVVIRVCWWHRGQTACGEGVFLHTRVFVCVCARKITKSRIIKRVSSEGWFQVNATCGFDRAELSFKSKKKILKKNISMFISEDLYCHCINNTKKSVPPCWVHNVKVKYQAINRDLKRVDM